MEPELTIGAVAERTGVATSALRFYEDEGLIHSTRSSGGQRRYPRDTLRTFLHGMETSLLHAFLMFNSRAKIIFCLSQLHYDRSEVLREVFPEYVRQADRQGLQLDDRKPFDSIGEHFPSSIYLEIH